jgi:hypothetical protein
VILFLCAQFAGNICLGYNVRQKLLSCDPSGVFLDRCGKESEASLNVGYARGVEAILLSRFG